MIGDHIRALKGGHWIHGIDGGDRTVLHLAGGPGPRVLRTYRPVFVEGAEAVEVVAHREPVYPPRSVVARAWSPVRDPARGEMFRDSEAFALWCKSGRIPGPAPVRTRPPSTPALEPTGRRRPAAARKSPARKAPARKTPARRPPASAKKRPAPAKARRKKR